MRIVLVSCLKMMDGLPVRVRVLRLVIGRVFSFSCLAGFAPFVPFDKLETLGVVFCILGSVVFTTR